MKQIAVLTASVLLIASRCEPSEESQSSNPIPSKVGEKTYLRDPRTNLCFELRVEEPRLFAIKSLRCDEAIEVKNGKTVFPYDTRNFNYLWENPTCTACLVFASYDLCGVSSEVPCIAIPRSLISNESQLPYDWY